MKKILFFLLIGWYSLSVFYFNDSIADSGKSDNSEATSAKITRLSHSLSKSFQQRIKAGQIILNQIEKEFIQKSDRSKLLYSSPTNLNADFSDELFAGRFNPVIRSYINSNLKTKVTESQFNSNDLVVGQSDPYEVRTITGNFFLDGNIWIINHGTLNIEKANFTIKGNISVADSGSLYIYGGEFTVQSMFVYQYNIFVQGDALLEIDSVEFDFNNKSWNAAFVERSRVRISNSNFRTVITSFVAHKAAVQVQHANPFEFVVADSARITFSHSGPHIVWFYFPESSHVDMSFPDGEFIPQFELSPTTPGVEGIAFTVTMDSTSDILWGMFPLPGSDLTVRDSYLRTTGLFFLGNDADTLSGIVNNSYYSDYTLPLTDRHYHLINTIVKTWNIYSGDQVQLTLDDNILGELLIYGYSATMVQNCLFDGSGGYVSAHANSSLTLLLTTTVSPVISRDRSMLIVGYSAVLFGELHAVEASVMLLINALTDVEPSAEDTAVVVELAIKSPTNATINALIPITGTARLLTGPYNPLSMQSYRLYYSSDTSEPQWIPISGFHEQPAYNDVLDIWNTQGLSPGNYLLKLTMFVGTDSLEATRFVQLKRSITTTWQNVVLNGSFEQTLPNGPKGWQVNAFEDPLMRYRADWGLDSSRRVSGKYSLKIAPHIENSGKDFSVYQVLDVPGYDLQDKPMTISGYIKTEGLEPDAMAAILLSLMGKQDTVSYRAEVEPTNGMFKRYEWNFTAPWNVDYAGVMLLVQGGTGTVWFDSVEVFTEIDSLPLPPPVALDTVQIPITERTFKLSFSNSPYNASNAGWNDLFQKISENGKVVDLPQSIKWNELNGYSISDAYFELATQVAQARERRLEVFIAINWLDIGHTGHNIQNLPEGYENADFSHPALRQAFQQEMVSLASMFQPEYFSLGVEIGGYYNGHPEDFPNFVSLYKECYDAIKSVSPTTKVFVYFRLPFLNGWEGGVYDSTRAHYDVMNHFEPKLDFAAFSTYPGLDFEDPEDIPDTYYTEILNHTNRSILIAESGYRSTGTVSTSTFSSSEAEQAAFLRKLLTTANMMNVEVLNWWYLYDQMHFMFERLFPENANWLLDSFRGMGLIHVNRMPKQGWYVWQKAASLPLTTNVKSPLSSVSQLTYFLDQNYPNPFNPRTTIRFTIPTREHVILKVYNIRGREIATLVDGTYEAGNYSISFDIQNLSSGVYFYRLKAGRFKQARKMVGIR